MPDLSPVDLLSRLRRDVERSVLRSKNGLKVLGGIGRPATGTTPKETVVTAGKATMWRYRSDKRSGRPPLMIVHSLASRSYLFDFNAGNSFIETLVDQGFDVFLVDWGSPDELDATNTLETYCDILLPQMISACLEASGAESLHLFGYCLGGVLTLLYLAGHPDAPVSKLITMATPIDFEFAMAPFGQMVRDGRIDASTLIDHTGNVPSEVIFNVFRMLAPTSEVTGYAALWNSLWDDDFVDEFQRTAGWSKDQVPFPGATMLQLEDLFVKKNLMATGQLPLGGRVVDLADITAPFLNIIGGYDHVVSPAANGKLVELVGSSDKQEFIHPTGHIGLVIGRHAQTRFIPAITEWLHRENEVVQ
jgi:polyhydroxyalkanoate synthase